MPIQPRLNPFTRHCLALTARVSTLHNRYKVYISESFDPGFNLSVEEWLMDNCGAGEKVLFIWQNENTIVIGRNQNPYKECDLKKLREDGVRLVRRLSGGGAVYHDLGNLNFTFIEAENHFNMENNVSIILDALSAFGIKGSFNGRNDLVVSNWKFSGNAFFSSGGTNCHHGTLLVDVDFGKLTKYLTVSPLKLKSKGIDSIKSRVINLKTLSGDISVVSLKNSLIKSFNDFYETEAEVGTLGERAVDLRAYQTKYSSLEWNYSESPDFSVVIEEKFEWGLVEASLEVNDGIIRNCRIHTDALFTEGFQGMEKRLVGEKFDKDSILKSINSQYAKLRGAF
ncbi:MAG: lipoate--protein ligase [Clostridiaceae bacterium]